MLTLYKASAGSGKTYNLAYEYIRNLLGVKPKENAKYRLNHPDHSPHKVFLPDRHRHILAITFTNKATEEMKRRIIDELDALTRIPDPNTPEHANYAPALCKELGCSRTHLAESARMALHNLLYDYHNFNVTTIDSFFQRVLRTFARELDYQGDYCVELNDKVAVQQSIDSMLDDFNAIYDPLSPPKPSDPTAVRIKNLGNWIFAYITRLIDEGKRSNLFNRSSSLYMSLVRLLSGIYNENFQHAKNRMRDYLSDPKAIANYTTWIDKVYDTLVIRMQQTAIAARKALMEIGMWDAMAGTKPHRHIELCLPKPLRRKDDRPSIPLFDLDGDGLRKEFTDPSALKLISGDAQAYTRTPLKGNNAAIAICMDYSAAAYDLYNYLNNIRAVRHSLTQLWLLSYAWPYLDNFTAENNTLLLSDTTHLLSTIIGKDETPFIYERMGVQLHNFLIDEFQDTSRMQWSNLFPLVKNSISQGFDNLIIGDEKQSIYRFRNSDSELIRHIVPNVDFPTSTVLKGHDAGQNTNHRSAPLIIRFNNTLFTNMAAQQGIPGYDNVVQQIASKNLKKHAYIHFIPFDKLSKSLDDQAVLMDRMIAEMLDQHNRGYEWGDIVVLVRSNKECMAIVDRLLDDPNNIPVLSDEALYLEKSPTVQLIVSMLKLIDRQQPPQAADSKKSYIYATPSDVSVITSRIEYFKNTGMDYARAIEQAINTAKDHDDSDSVLISSLQTIKERKPSTLVSLVETIIHELDLGADASQLPYIATFQDFVIDVCQRQHPTLTTLINIWEQKKDKLCIPMSSAVNAVRVMTAHKSKGLEFKCLHVPFASWDIGRSEQQLWVDTPDIASKLKIDPEKLPAPPAPPMLYLVLNTSNNHENALLYDKYTELRHNDAVDTMNLLYVAYTRAERELIVYYCPSEGVGQWLKPGFAAGNPDPSNPLLMDISHPDIDNLPADEYIFGEKTSWPPADDEVDEKDKKTDTNDDADDDTPKRITQTVRRLENYPVYYHADTAVLTNVKDTLEEDVIDDDTELTDNEADLDVYPDDESRRRGIMLHSLMSRIEYASDAPKVLKNLAHDPSIPADETRLLTSTIKAMLAHPEASRWFAEDNEVSVEQSIYLPDLDKSRRPDRVVFRHDGAVEVVDYKFTSETSSHHRRQVNRYVKLLQRMGYTNVTGYLWYPMLATPTIQQVISDK